MNPNELAAKMLEWADLRAKLDVVEQEIASAVLAIGQSKTTGNVVATYSKGTREFDYQTPAAKLAGPEIIAKYTKTEPVIDWRAICAELKVEPVVVSQKPPSVKVKIKESK